MSVLPRSVEKVIESFEKLPGIGPKSAARLTYFLLRAPKERSLALAESLSQMKEQTVLCQHCYNVADRSPCGICTDPGRDRSRLCVVEEPLDVVALEKSGVFTGRYFVLGGVVSPAEGIGPEQLRFAEFRERVKAILAEQKTDGESAGGKAVNQENRVRAASEADSTGNLEIIIATNPSLEGEATASYVIQVVKELTIDSLEETIVITRLAMGLPTGADLEYADRLTLKRALEGRTRVGGR